MYSIIGYILIFLFIDNRFFFKWVLEAIYVNSEILNQNLGFFFFRFDEIAAKKVPKNEIIVMYDIKDRKSVNKLQDINHDPIFRQYIEHEKILDIAENFTGPNIMAVHSMLIAKPPDIGFGTSR